MHILLVVNALLGIPGRTDGPESFRPTKFWDG